MHVQYAALPITGHFWTNSIEGLLNVVIVKLIYQAHCIKQVSSFDQVKSYQEHLYSELPLIQLHEIRTPHKTSLLRT